MKKLLVALLLTVSVLSLSACKGGDDGLDKDITGEITLMTWAGNGVDYLDIGHQTYTADDLTNQKVASVYAMAKAFNEIYPNVKINYYGKINGPDDGGVYWDQELANYAERTGSYPSVFLMSDTVQLLKQGVLADLSGYADHELYKTLNEGLLVQGNYYGAQVALPSYFVPHGFYVNQSLIESEFLDEVDPDWTFDEFTDLVSNGNGLDDGYSGLGQLPASWMKQMFVYDALYDDGEVDLDTELFKDFFRNGMEEWNPYQFYAHEEEYQKANNSWAQTAFLNGKVTVYTEEPWYLNSFAIIDGPSGAPDGFDIYPFPDYNGSGTTISTVTDPIGVYNYCGADGDPECTEEEQAQLDLAAEFALFMIADTRSWEARAAQEYGEVDSETKQVTKVTGAGDASLPVTQGDAFNEQMAYWYQIGENSYYEDKVGFNAVLDIIEEGDVKAISDKIFPWFYTDEVTEERRMIFDELWNYYQIDDQAIGDPGWEDAFFAKLPSWTDTFNERLSFAYQEIQDSLVEYYGYAEDDSRFTE